MISFIGASLAQYRILKRIGRGGMAMVYKAYQPALGRDVAMKILPAHLTDEPGIAQRFKREARAVAMLLSMPGWMLSLEYQTSMSNSISWQRSRGYLQRSCHSSRSSTGQISKVMYAQEPSSPSLQERRRSILKTRLCERYAY